MLRLLVFILRLILGIFVPKFHLICKIAQLQKENEIYKRNNADKPIKFIHSDRVIFTILAMLSNHVKKTISIVSPRTLLFWQKELIKNFWTYRTQKRPGRPRISSEIKELILSMKNDNLFWGAKKIHGELLKLAINISTPTIRKILRILRKEGKIQPSLTWSKFIKSQAESIFAIDALTVDTIFFKRYYVHFIIRHSTREIVQFVITEFPIRERIKQMLADLEDSVKRSIYLIHDNAGEFYINYSMYNIKGVATSVEAPNMNAIAERFVGSIRRECLDNFILINEQQIKRIVSQYIEYYNSMRTHQGINYGIPKGFDPEKNGKIRKLPILGGIHHHYYREAA